MNIVIITSVCNTINAPLTYTQNRSVFSWEQRYQQLLETIKSTRKHIPNSYIVLIEYSELKPDQEKCLESLCDVFHNTVGILPADKIFSKWKGRGELTQMQYVLDIMLPKIKMGNVKHIFKISGRYKFGNNFDYKLYDNDKLIFKKIKGNIQNIYTAMFKIPYKYLDKFTRFICDPTNQHSIVSIYKGSYETFMAKFVTDNISDVKFLYPLGVEGKVSVCGSQHFG